MGDFENCEGLAKIGGNEIGEGESEGWMGNKMEDGGTIRGEVGSCRLRSVMKEHI